MMSRRRIIIIGIAVLAVLGGAVALLELLPEQGNNTGASPSPVTTGAVVTATLIDELEEDVANVVFTPREGSKYTIVRNQSDGALAMTAEGEMLFPPKISDLATSFNTAIKIVTATFVTENADDGQISLFGLDKPVMTVRVNMTDGSYTEMEIGVISAKNSGRYVRQTGGREVYILTSYATDKLSRSVSDFYSYTFLPDYITPASEESPTYYAFVSASLTYGEKLLGVERDIEAETDFMLVKPYEVVTNSHTLGSEFLTPITNIAPSELVEAHPSDLSQYGLDSPAVLELKDAEGWSGTLLIGKYDQDAGGRYVMIQGIDAVLLDKADAYLFLEATVSRMRSGLAWSHNIASVTSIDFLLGGKTRRMEYKHYADGTLSARLDGVEVLESNARRLYSSMLSVGVNGDTDTDVPDKQPAYKFTITMIDGTQETLELYELNDRQYLIVYNGENLKAFTYKTTLHEKLLIKFDMLENGEELPRF